MENKTASSPDVTHIVTAVAGNRLPQLCGQVWQDNQYPIHIAKFNGLNPFRDLQPNNQLIFPPLTPST